MIRTVYRVDTKGSLDYLERREEELSDPGDNEVTVEVQAIGLNFADIFAIQGLYSAAPKGSFIPGLEYSGKVIAVGKKVKLFRKNDKVMGVSRFGAYADHLNIDQRYIYKLPPRWSYEQGAGFLVQALTAYYALVPLGNLCKGQTVLIHSAAGGVGIYANRIAKKFGAWTVGTVGNPSKISLLEKERYDAWIIRSSSFPQELKTALGGRELNLVLECIGGRIFQDSYQALAPMGRMIVYGSASFMSQGDRVNWPSLAWKYLTRPKVDPMEMVSDNKAIMGFNLIWLYDRVNELSQHIKDMIKLNLEPPHIGGVYSFVELPEAVKYFQTGQSTGKIVVTSGDKR
ncbi:oxidoreductase, zinc-binding dehydrogenase family protein [Leptospira broomii serovar Hurstbridge str. 5399]|uniref:Oxidoreductase, zinc-binding dehydrogenase family protein n=1 Tax=Leptospira broomii serovar Hurstbridge str. 5399 TaxID=1049789 RepID=T0F3I5_9LEPT|nr:medium chain dehydrogenase/reductase family protein [Leptospira broomii]EQA45645.1 oxidoreductase, zinc-binding dehydrogenase family protein [Leptospira broomii serovar Hurstbridge str. 5399]